MAYLIGCAGCFAVRNGAGAVFDGLAERRIQCALHDCVKVEEIIEESINLDHIRMTNILLYFDLPYKLLHHITVSYFPFGHDLNGD